MGERKMRNLKRSTAKFVMLVAIVLSAFSIAGALATNGVDGGGPLCPFATCP